MKRTIDGIEYEGSAHPNGGGFVRDGISVPEHVYVGERAVILGGTFRGGMFCGGTFYDGTFRGGTFWGGTFYGGTFYDGMFCGGMFCGGTFYDGTFTRSPSCAQRSDGWMFIAKKLDNAELRIWTGCRNFSWDEAVAHWNDSHPHGKESQRIIHFLREQEESK